MSSVCSDADVIRTRISVYDDDDTVLYAYEPNTAVAHANNPGSIPSDISYAQEQQKTVLEVLNHCQAIQDAIKNLDKKFDVISGKVTKIHRIHVKSLWQSRKPLGYTYKNYSYLLSRKSKSQKLKKKELSPRKTSSYVESYTPTIPVGRRDNDSCNIVASPYQSEDSLERDREAFYENQDLGLNQSHSPIFPQSYQPYYTSDNPAQGYSSMPNYSSAGLQGTNSIFSSAQAPTAVSTDITAQDRPSAVHNREMITYPPLLENKSLNCATSSVCIPVGYSATTLVGTDPGMLKQSCSGDPSAWSVEEVVLFLKCTDPHTFTQLADLFRQHDIDGKALLLLNSEMMIKYLGLKLGTTVKLCHYIEKLKGEK